MYTTQVITNSKSFSDHDKCRQGRIVYDKKSLENEQIVQEICSFCSQRMSLPKEQTSHHYGKSALHVNLSFVRKRLSKSQLYNSSH